MRPSFWLETGGIPEYTPLAGDREADAVVIGGGITGMTTALMLARDGLDVALIERHRLAACTTGNTTGKVTSQHGAIYDRLERTLGDEHAHRYGAASEAAKEMVGELASGIECDLRRRPAYVYAASADERAQLEREAEVAARLGLPASFTDDVPVPFATHGSVRFDDQIEFNPGKYVAGLARAFTDAGGDVYEQTTAMGVHRARPRWRVETNGGSITARHVVVATLMPMLDRGAFFARAFANRSYVVTARIAGGPPAAMLISAGDPTRSIRPVKAGDDELLMIGGEGHKVGSSEASPERYERLEAFAREHWEVEAIDHRWSSQDYIATDHVPFIGPVHPLARDVYVATGFGKWGMTSGTLAATVVAAAVRGDETEWDDLVWSLRARPRAEARSLLLDNARSGLAMVGDRLRYPGRRSSDSLAPGEAGIVSHDGLKVAGFRDDGGKLHAVSARCTHLGCQVRWNAAERTWDCPCHASRFGIDGDVIEGPATKPLEPR